MASLVTLLKQKLYSMTLSYHLIGNYCGSWNIYHN